MDKKALLAEATRKLENQHAPDAEAAIRSGDSEPSDVELVANRPRKYAQVKPVISKGITLRPNNIEKLDRIELSLRTRGIKAGHSGLIQIAIDRLEDDSELEKAYRALLKLDLRLK